MHFDENYDPYKAAYGSMPSHAAANPEMILHYFIKNYYPVIHLARIDIFPKLIYH